MEKQEGKICTKNFQYLVKKSNWVLFLLNMTFFLAAKGSWGFYSGFDNVPFVMQWGLWSLSHLFTRELQFVFQENLTWKMIFAELLFPLNVFFFFFVTGELLFGWFHLVHLRLVLYRIVGRWKSFSSSRSHLPIITVIPGMLFIPLYLLVQQLCYWGGVLLIIAQEI